MAGPGSNVLVSSWLREGRHYGYWPRTERESWHERGRVKQHVAVRDKELGGRVTPVAKVVLASLEPKSTDYQLNT
jgi:hypothetical protein